MTALQGLSSRGTASREPNDSEKAPASSASSVAHRFASLMASEVGPSLLTVAVMLCLIFGGCCSNVCPVPVWPPHHAALPSPLNPCLP